MARVPRKSYESSYFHVIVQGYEKEYIFKEDYYKDYYLKLLLNESKNFEVCLLAYCIMGNHVHIMIYCDEIEQMSLYMKNVNTKYAVFYNLENNRVGYVFRDRFLSEPIMSEKYLYNCIPYIHMNPVEAGMVHHPEAYKYSSYNDFIKKEGIVTDEVLIKLFGHNENYIELFQFLHFGYDNSFDFKKDEKKPTFAQSKMIIENKIKEIGLDCDLKKEDNRIQKFFSNMFIRENIPVSHIEKVLNIHHQKIKAIINSDV